MLRQTMMALRIRRALAAAPRRGISSGGVVCSAEVRAALDRRGPVVALESTIITHGMPYPRNLEVARAVEARVRAGGAVPATVAVLDGKLRVGLSDAELERVAVAGDRGAAVKCSRRDLADVASRSANDGALVGATTVAGTAVAAHLAGVEVFATGGIGGVHRGAEATFDVSADLVELGRTPILVVCAGVKSILDVPKTLEVLETQGVAVIGYGTDDLAAFFAARSSDNNKINRAPLRYDDAAGVAGWLAKNAELGLASGAVLAVPNPAPMDGDAIDGAIAAALEAAAARGVSGKDATPFLLAKLEEVTGGASLEANVALVLNNARVAAEIAVARARGGPARRPPDVAVVGASTVDVVGRAGGPCAGTSAPGAASTTFGGVGRNVAVAAARAGASTTLATAAEPRSLAALAADGVDASFAAATAASSTYVAVHDGAGDLVGAVFAEDAAPRPAAGAVAAAVAGARVVVADANGDAATYAALLDALTDDQALWLEPTSAAKAGAAFAALLPRVAVVTPAERELDPLLAALGADVNGGVGERALRLAEAMREAAGDAGDRAVLVTRGDRGALLAVAGDDVVTSFPAPKPPRVVSSNGAGDALCGVAAAAVARGADLRSAARAGLAAAALTLGSPGSAPPGVDGAWLDGILSGK